MPITNNIVFPANAGMNRRMHGGIPRIGSVPRKRGDEPTGSTYYAGDGLCSPQTRG